jgi:hypothetical protein
MIWLCAFIDAEARAMLPYLTKKIPSAASINLLVEMVGYRKR